MKRLTAFFLSLGLFLSSHESVAQSSAVDVAVRLRPLKGKISVAGMSLRVIGQNSETLLKSRGYDRLELTYSGRSWSVFDHLNGKILLEVAGPKIDISADEMRVDLRPAPSRIRLVAVPKGNGAELNLVGVLSLDEYIEGVVSAEVPKDWPLEALKAQAVAARSFTLAKLRDRGERTNTWQLESSIMDQVFDHSRRHDLAAKAVAETRGQFLVTSIGRDSASGELRVATTHYHSDCGGQTDEPKDVWGGGENIGTAKDLCPKSPRTNWRLITSLGEITAKLRDDAVTGAAFRVASLDIEKRSPAGRAQVLRLTDDKGKSIRLSGEKMRSVFGYMNLRSTLFDVKVASASRVEFSGRGFGHGTGLCQWGSRQMALAGKTYQEILSHYYPKLALTQL